jgi:hypothetical protein
MSRYEEFVESLSVGKARTEAEELEREERDCSLPLAVGDVLRRMCHSFRCPVDRVRYVDTRAHMGTGTLHGGAPLLRYIPEKGRYCLDVEISVAGKGIQAPYPVWIYLEVVPLRHGGMEIHLGPSFFQLPEEEQEFFDCMADCINSELRERYSPAPRRIGC